MSTIISNNFLTISYLLIWVATLVYYQYKNRNIDAGTAIIGTYIIYAICSIQNINDPIFGREYKPLTLFPYIYLYLMLIIALSPTIYNHVNSTNKIENPNTRILFILGLIIIITALLQIPDIARNFKTGFVKLFTDVDAGKDAYEESAMEQDDTGTGITNLASIIYNSLSDLAVFLFFYFLTIKNSKKVYLLLLFFAFAIGLLIPVMRGQRTGVILGILTLVSCYLLFRRYLSKRINKIITITGTFIIALTLLPAIAITVSRFGDRAAGVNGYLNWYIGQGSLYFNNYGLNPGGTRHGERTMNLFIRVIKPDTPKNYNERRAKYHNLKIDDYYFTTFVGDFAIDFGPVVTVFIFLIFNGFVLINIKHKDKIIRVDQLLLLYFSQCICMQGGMYLFAYSDEGNLKIITTSLLYAYLRYHRRLIEKYPLIPVKKENES